MADAVAEMFRRVAPDVRDDMLVTLDTTHRQSRHRCEGATIRITRGREASPGEGDPVQIVVLMKPISIDRDTLMTPPLPETIRIAAIGRRLGEVVDMGDGPLKGLSDKMVVDAVPVLEVGTSLRLGVGMTMLAREEIGCDWVP